MPPTLNPKVRNSPRKGHFRGDHALPDGLAGAGHGTDLWCRNGFAAQPPEPTHVRQARNAPRVPAVVGQFEIRKFSRA